MGKRRAPRVLESYSARIYGLDSGGKPFSVSVQTLDVSHSGARVTGIKQLEKPGEVIGLESNGRKSRFVVVWVGRKGSKHEGQVGLRSVEPDARIWEVELPRGGEDRYHAPHVYSSGKNSEVLTYLEWRDERRMKRRVAVRAGAKIKGTGSSGTGWGVCTDITPSGCYIETANPLPLDSRTELVLRVHGREIAIQGLVRNSKKQWGMGIEFTNISDADKKFLAELGAPPRRVPGRAN